MKQNYHSDINEPPNVFNWYLIQANLSMCLKCLMTKKNDNLTKKVITSLLLWYPLKSIDIFQHQSTNSTSSSDLSSLVNKATDTFSLESQVRVLFLDFFLKF